MPIDLPESILTILNDGKDVLQTNYWDTEPALNGKFFVSVNGGCIRLLVPESQYDAIPDIKSGVEVILSRGPWPAMDLPQAYEFVFEDYTDTPFAIQIGIEQWDLHPEKSQRWTFAAFTKDGKIHECPMRFRDVDSLPYLKPWIHGEIGDSNV